MKNSPINRKFLLFKWYRWSVCATLTVSCNGSAWVNNGVTSYDYVASMIDECNMGMEYW